MGRKPSVTKQIATALDTDDKRVQLERIQGLLKTAQAPVVAVTVLLSMGKVEVTVAGERVAPENVKAILNMGVDEITKSVLQYEMEQKQPEPSLEEEAEEPPNDSEVPQA